MYRERITILYDDSEPEKEALKACLQSQGDTLGAAAAVEKTLSALGYPVRRLPIVHERMEALMEALFHAREDVIFNLCEDIRGEGIYESYMVGLLELLGMAYTGSAPLTLALCLDKAKTQKLLSAHGLPTPRHLVLTGEERIPDGIRFPLIVKLLREDGSLGVSKDSVVYGKKSLWKQVRKMVSAYDQPVIAEEYIDGRELNIAVLGNGEEAEVLPISEIDHSGVGENDPKILTYASKWDERSREYRTSPPVCPASLSPGLEKNLRTLAKRACRILGCRDYARVDVRLKEKIPYIIEVNPNPAISSDAGFVRSANVAGLSYADLVGKIVSFAVARKRAKARKRHTWLETRQAAS